MFRGVRGGENRARSRRKLHIRVRDFSRSRKNR
jgi:hypothetical protein